MVALLLPLLHEYVLAPVAVNSCTESWPVALVAIATVIAFSVFGRGMFKIIPILMGVVASYLAAVIFGKFGWCDAINYDAVAKAAWIGLPVKWENTVFSILTGSPIHAAEATPE